MSRELPVYASADKQVPRDWLDLDVYIDGVKSEEVVEANTEEGWYVVHKRDERGRLMIKGESLIPEKRQAKVEFRWRS